MGSIIQIRLVKIVVLDNTKIEDYLDNIHIYTQMYLCYAHNCFMFDKTPHKFSFKTVTVTVKL